MSAIRFRCPHCRRSARVAGTLAGKQGRCPKCHGVVQVPETPVGDKVIEVLSVPLPVLYTVQWAACGAAILWVPLFYDTRGFQHLLPYGWTLLAIVGLGLVALQLMVGAKRLTLGESGLILEDQTIRWKDVKSLEVSTAVREHKVKHADCTAELTTKDETYMVPHSYCLDAKDHWGLLLDPRYRARKNREVADSIQAQFGAKKTKSHKRLIARERTAA